MQQCAVALRGQCKISFEEDHTLFTLQCEVEVHSTPQFVHTLKLPSSFALVGVDDSKMQRVILGRLFKNLDLPASCTHLFGATYAEVVTCTESVGEIMDKFDYTLCIFDQHLDYPEGTLYGTDLSKIVLEMAKRKNRRVVTFIRSANDSSADVRMYREMATDSLPKKAMNRREFREIVVPHIVNAFGSADGEIAEADSEVNEMLSILQEELRPLLPGLVESKSQDPDWSNVWRSLHRIKGGCQVVEMNEASEVVATIDSWKGESYPEEWEVKVEDLIVKLEVMLLPVSQGGTP